MLTADLQKRFNADKPTGVFGLPTQIWTKWRREQAGAREVQTEELWMRLQIETSTLRILCAVAIYIRGRSGSAVRARSILQPTAQQVALQVTFGAHGGSSETNDTL